MLTAELSDFRNPDGYGMGSWYAAVFDGPVQNNLRFWEAYVRELERLSDPAYLDALFEDLDEEIEAATEIH